MATEIDARPIRQIENYLPGPVLGRITIHIEVGDAPELAWLKRRGFTYDGPRQRTWTLRHGGQLAEAIHELAARGYGATLAVARRLAKDGIGPEIPITESLSGRGRLNQWLSEPPTNITVDAWAATEDGFVAFGRYIIPPGAAE